MSAQGNLSQELFFTATRGLVLPKNKKINKGNIGMHWTTSPEVAHMYAGLDPEMSDDFGKDATRQRVILHGQIPVSSVETDKGTLRKLEADQYPEDEVTVKKGSPMQVTKMTTHRGVGPKFKSRTRSYNPPRQMQA